MHHQKRVLVVEDEAEVMFVWTMALQRVPEIDVAATAHGDVALEWFRAAPFDLVVTDLSIITMGRVELTRAIRQLNAQVPIVWVTAHERSGESAGEKGLNVHTFFAKPVSIQQMRQVVCDALEL